MYRILIADDEQLELMVLREALEDYLGDCCEVIPTVNGREAVRKALASKVDIAVMDIEMPGLNGIEASRMISASLPECKIIMLTAYGKFDYAKQSIEIGALEYLLKPVSDELLRATVDKVTAQIDMTRNDVEQRAGFSRKIHDLTSRLEEQLVLTVMGGYLSPEQSASLLGELGVSFENGVFAIFCGMRELSADSVKELISAYPWGENTHVIPYEYDSRVYVLAFSSGGEYCAGIIEDAAHSLCNSTHGGVFAAIGGEFGDISDAQHSFFAARQLLESCSEVQPVRKSPTAARTEPIPEDVRDGHILRIKTEILHYMQHNYHRDIFLQTVAGEMNYSETYFSKLFKQCFSRNFITYLTEVRVEAAKELLCGQNKLTVKEVGEKVGYTDPNYFTKVFRRSTGQSPTEFRMSCIHS